MTAAHTEKSAADEPTAELGISQDKLCYIIIKAREFDVKVDPVEEKIGSNAVDDGERQVLEDFADDPTLAELREAIEDLNEDEVVELIALAWVGRGDFGRAEWREAVALARDRHRLKSADYLIGMPLLGDYLEEGYAALGGSCEAVSIDHL
jgi:hypothetical protein